MGSAIGIIISAVLIIVLLVIYSSNKDKDKTKEIYQTQTSTLSQLLQNERLFFPRKSSFCQKKTEEDAKQEIMLSFKKTYDTVFEKIKGTPLYDEKTTAPIVAAAVFVATDLPLMPTLPLLRKEIAEKIFNIPLKRRLSEKQFKIFDEACDLFAMAMRGEISLRGEWVIFDIDRQKNSLMIVYGDVLSNPNMVFNYSKEPVMIKNTFEIVMECQNILESYIIIDKHMKNTFLSSKKFMLESTITN